MRASKSVRVAAREAGRLVVRRLRRRTSTVLPEPRLAAVIGRDGGHVAGGLAGIGDPGDERGTAARLRSPSPDFAASGGRRDVSNFILFATVKTLKLGRNRAGQSCFVRVPLTFVLTNLLVRMLVDVRSCSPTCALVLTNLHIKQQEQDESGSSEMVARWAMCAPYGANSVLRVQGVTLKRDPLAPDVWPPPGTRTSATPLSVASFATRTPSQPTAGRRRSDSP